MEARCSRFHLSSSAMLDYFNGFIQQKPNQYTINAGTEAGRIRKNSEPRSNPAV